MVIGGGLTVVRLLGGGLGLALPPSYDVDASVSESDRLYMSVSSPDSSVPLATFPCGLSFTYVVAMAASASRFVDSALCFGVGIIFIFMGA